MINIKKKQGYTVYRCIAHQRTDRTDDGVEEREAPPQQRGGEVGR